MRINNPLMLFLCILALSAGSNTFANEGGGSSSGERGFTTGVNPRFRRDPGEGVGGFMRTDMTPERFKMKPRKLNARAEVPLPRFASKKDVKKSTRTIKKWLKQGEKKVYDWMQSEAFKLTFGRFPLVSKIKSAKEDMEELFKNVKEIKVTVYNYGMSGLDEGKDHAANPYDDGIYADEYYEGIDGMGKETQEKAKSMWEKEIKSK